MDNYIVSELKKTCDVFDQIINDGDLLDRVDDIAKVIISVLKKGNKIMFCGNGGSAADSQHLAAELVSKLSYDRPGLNAIALTVDTSALTAIGNDYGYDKAFARQVESVGQEGDILVAISTSGRSVNVLEAVKVAKKKSITTIGFLGKEGRNIGELVDYQMNIPSIETPKIQEGHIALGHIICGLVEENLFGKDYNPETKTA